MAYYNLIAYYALYYKTRFFELNYWLFAIVLSVGLSTSEALMSIGFGGLVGNWILEGKWQDKIKHLKKNKNTILILIAGYLFLLLAMLYTSDLASGWNDLKIKLPLLLFPIIYSSITLPKNYITLVFRFFILGLLASTLISVLYYVYKGDTISDIREVSIFISHIRLGVFINFAIVLLVYYYRQGVLFNKTLSLLFIVWFVGFLMFLQAVTGWFILFTLIIVTSLYILYRNSGVKIKLFVTGFVLLIFALGYFRVSTVYQNHFVPNIKHLSINELDTHSASGEKYTHFPENNWVENGHRVWVYIATKELEKAWNERSSIPFGSVDKKQQPMWGTIYRYMASKGLRKDKEGLKQLSDEDIRKIENGQTNCCENLSGIDKRIKEMIFEFERFKNNHDPNGHSFTQRYLYLIAGKDVFLNHFWTGVGTGDVKQHFFDYYKKTNSPLTLKNQKIAHNQFMVIAVATGIIGLIVWLTSLYYPLLIDKPNQLLYLYFLLVVSLSFLTDNTLERHAGVLFFAFFNSLLLFQQSSEKARSSTR